ncbi:MAG: hypothetical protein WCD47_19140 [Candidatus Sulfotelmatobacter sp.]
MAITHAVHVPKRLRNKLRKIQNELSEQGVDVRFDVRVKRAYKAVGISAKDVWETLGHVWLLFSIAKTAIGNWRKIREFLVNAGLTNDEITTLGLSKITAKPKTKAKPKKKSKKKKNVK